jgi:hypothetical protein
VRISADCYRLRLVKPKRILKPLSLSFLLTFSMNVLRSSMGFSATLGSFLFTLADTGLIIAYVRGLGQIGVYLPIPTRPKGGFAPLIHPMEILGGNR